ncbi:MAG: hypothetical protein J0665_16455 [Deltaproteobacteria bacterium]|nr:hypothetical protein [Deltaproteobacteria bacterium]
MTPESSPGVCLTPILEMKKLTSEEAARLDKKIQDFVDSLPELTPEQEAMFDERGDLIETPEEPPMEYEIQGETIGIAQIVPSEVEYRFSSPPLPQKDSQPTEKQSGTSLTDS